MLTDQAAADADYRDPVARLSQLLDTRSVVPIHAGSSGVCVVRGRIDTDPVVAYCTDARTMGDAMGVSSCRHIVDGIDTAVREGVPAVGLWHTGDARLAGGIAALEGVGGVFASMIRASGLIPQITVVLGSATGGAAYGPALTDLVIMSTAGRVFVTGPEVVRAVTGEQIDVEELGGPETHSSKSGVAHILAESELDAFSEARRITGFFTRPGEFNLNAVGAERDLGALLPGRPRRAYDVRPLVREVLDSDSNDFSFKELQPKWAPNIVVGLGRLAGRSVGIVANNPLRKGGCLNSLSAEKAARFVRMCDSYGIPLLVIVDVPGYLPGVREEWEGVVRRGAKLLHAFAEATVPRVTLITRKSYGGGYIAMNSRALGATAVFAWPEAEIAVMGAEAAVRILHRRQLAELHGREREELRAALIHKHRTEAGGVDRALALGVIDEVIDPAQTRQKLAAALSRAPVRRGSHGNIPL